MTALSNTRVLVTGASGQLGARIAHLLGQNGARVALSGRDEKRLADIAGGSDSYQVDLSLPGAGKALIDAVLEDGPINGIVFAHGAVAFGTVAETPMTVVEDLSKINALSVMEMVSAVIPAMEVQKASSQEPIDQFLVSISGVISELPTAGMSAYGASKSALRSYQQVASRELRRQGIRFVDARPGHTETGLATRAVFGVAPAFPEGFNPDSVAERIVQAIMSGEKDLPPEAFSS